MRSVRRTGYRSRWNQVTNRDYEKSSGTGDGIGEMVMCLGLLDRLQRRWRPRPPTSQQIWRAEACSSFYEQINTSNARGIATSGRGVAWMFARQFVGNQQRSRRKERSNANEKTSEWKRRSGVAAGPLLVTKTDEITGMELQEPSCCRDGSPKRMSRGWHIYRQLKQV